MSKVQHMIGRKTGCNRSRPVFFSVFRFFDKCCNWQLKKFRICATATGGLVFFRVQFDFGLFSGPANWTCEHYPLIPAGIDLFHWNLQEWHRNPQKWAGIHRNGTRMDWNGQEYHRNGLKWTFWS